MRGMQHETAAKRSNDPPPLWILKIRRSVAHTTIVCFGFCLALLSLPNYSACDPSNTTSGAEQVSIGFNGAQPEMGKPNSSPVIPHNGSFVLFTSLANNLTNGTHSAQTSPTYNIYKREKSSDVTELISVRPDGLAPQRLGGSSTGAQLGVGAIEPAVSDVASDGSFAVAFTSDAYDLLVLITSSRPAMPNWAPLRCTSESSDLAPTVRLPS